MPTYLSPGVYIEEKEAGSRPIEGVGTAVAAFVGATAKGPYNSARLVSNWGQFVATFGEFVPGGYTPLAVYNYFDNGGGSAYVVRIGQNGASPDDGAASAVLESASQSGVPAYRVRALEEGEAGNDISVEVVPERPAAKPKSGDDGGQEGGSGGGSSGSSSGGDDASDAFKLIVKRDGRPIETYDGLTSRRGKQNAATLVNKQSTTVRVEELGSVATADRTPAAGEIQLSGVVPAQLPATLDTDEFVGDTAARTGLGSLEAIEGVTMVLMPDLMAAYQRDLLDLDGVKAIQLALVSHCEAMGDRMAILDAPPGLDALQVKQWRVEKSGFDTKFAALYWPWVKVYDPGTGQADFVPPSGAVAGVWSRSDDGRGVHKAPANEVVRGALDVALDVTRVEHDLLNPEGINVIRSLPGRGIRIWGARTLSSDPAWRYLNVRRLFNYLEASILGGTQWVVFEPNDLDLWQRIHRTITAFLLGVWRSGALAGAAPEQAFYVKCDGETNPPDVVDRGQVIVEIGVAPVKPAEFVVFRLSQLVGGGQALEGG
jgi:Bacteriophage tail sheath protein